MVTFQYQLGNVKKKKKKKISEISNRIQILSPMSTVKKIAKFVLTVSLFSFSQMKLTFIRARSSVNLPSGTLQACKTFCSILFQIFFVTGQNVVAHVLICAFIMKYLEAVYSFSDLDTINILRNRPNIIYDICNYCNCDTDTLC